MGISVITTTHNSEAFIEDCLRSVSWADEILVVDSGSSDKTIDLALTHKARILTHRYENPTAQKLWSIPQAKNEWILWLDSDERVTLELADEIQKVINSIPSDYNGYEIPRQNLVLGEVLWHTGYYPDFQIRLFRRGYWSLASHIIIHEKIIIEGPIGRLKGPIKHLTHPNVDHMLDKLLLRWTKYEAEYRYSQGKRFSVWQMFARSFASFLIRYIRYRGYRDGLRGLFVSIVWGIYIIVIYIKMWEIDNHSEK